MTRISTGRRALAMTGAALAVTLTVALGACSTGSDDATAPTAPVAEATPGAEGLSSFRCIWVICDG